MTPATVAPLSRDFYRRLAEHAGLDYVVLDPELHDDPDFVSVSPLAARLFEGEDCRYRRMIPVSYVENTLTVAVAQPSDRVARQIATGLAAVSPAIAATSTVRFVVAPERDIEIAIEEIFGTDDGDGERDEASVLTKVDWPGQHFPPRLGGLLLEYELATQDQIEAALEEQLRTACRLSEILVAAGVVSEEELLPVLAEQFGMPVIDLTGYEPDPAALEVLPEPLMRRAPCVPIAIDSEKLYLAVADRLDEATTAEILQYTDLELTPFLASANQIEDLLRLTFRARYSDIAVNELVTNFPEEAANRVVSDGQKAFLSIFVVILLAGLIIAPLVTLIVLVSVAGAFYTLTTFYKFKLTYDSLGYGYEIAISDEMVAALDERDLPVFTVLVPLYREAAVLGALVEGIHSLDYPQAKLDIRLLCEEDDEETVEAVRALHLPPQFKLVVVPDAQPKTKPKACNYGLIQARGEYLVIFDAEDRPDPDQLKKVVIAYGNAEASVVCIQAKLNYFNAEQNLLTRWFCTEYSMWFDLLLPGLAHTNAPIPLGGTSCHFVTASLIELGAWDPYNVTEDADLGIRLHKYGFQTAMIDSTTFEEANSDLNNWIRQRSRWIKGYIQTWLVHMRHPGQLMRQIGVRNFISFQLLIGGTFIFLLNPIFWALTTLFFFTQANFVRDLFPSFVFYAAAFQLFLANFLFMYFSVAGCIQRGYFGLAKYALFSPIYWGLMSVAAWKGFLQLFFRPFYWEKTVHGLDRPPEGSS
ncbi:MAG: glycosyltransferase XagB [Solirubrobacteraceae bacterium]|nr:glycosyltransferase XagB [Solirubrobacteraceae bacterium]